MLIDFDVSEALLALGAIQDKALESSRIAAISTGDEHEIADLSAKLLQRVATRLTDALYPDVCPKRAPWGAACRSAAGHPGDCDYRETSFAAMRRADLEDE